MLQTCLPAGTSCSRMFAQQTFHKLTKYFEALECICILRHLYIFYSYQMPYLIDHSYDLGSILNLDGFI